MLVQNDLFSDIESLFTRLGTGRAATTSHSTPPMDAYRRGTDVWIHLDLPGVAEDSLDIDVERSVLTVKAQRDVLRQEGDQTYVSERRSGPYSRRFKLGENLDVEAIEANFTDGVLTLRVPVSEQAKARKVDVQFGPRSEDEPAGDPTQ